MAWTGEKAALAFVSDAYAHCKAIGYTAQAAPLMAKAGVEADAFTLDLPTGAEALIAFLSSRNWEREARVKLPV